ncbi:hypothetical protein OJ998_33025 [Solirubrobacter taibaiensis]|nr:hypothetical protein [Solirubrobacter taibaiensis]
MEGRFEHALLTTYSFNLRFFEEWVLRALWAAEVRNIVVFVDPGELGHALTDRAPSAAGRAYHVVAAKHAKAAFHPKVLLVTGAGGTRLCVSSANLTADGQLRNAESAIAFDSHVAGHVRPILDAGELFRRLSADAPAHTAAAIQQALASLPEDSGEDSPYRVVHNLDARLLDAFPSASAVTAIAPYIDADGSAAQQLHDRGRLTVVVDGERIAAAADFFAGPWIVDARRFDARLHGKAYELTTDGGRWVLVGSPNLSAPALLRTAAAGNLEVAVAVSNAPALALPPSEPFDAEDLPSAAAARLAVDREHTDAREATGRAFDAWEDERRIVVSGVPDGARIERWSAERWYPVGTVTSGAVLIADPDLRPTRIRAVLGDGRVAFAVVAQPARLRARMRAPTSGRQTEAARHLPLDVDTVRVLEDALAELYALSALAGESPPTPRPRRTVPETTGHDQLALIEWIPRSPDEEPRVPSLYRNAWKGEPDALLALISKVLRLELEDTVAGEDDVAREQLDIDEIENVTSAEQIDAAPSAEEAPRPAVDPKELDRYRRAFERLFARGQTFITGAKDPTLAGWAFTYLLRLVEELGSHHVDVSGQGEPLMPRVGLRAITLELLVVYLRRDERDLLCLATARTHLAAAIRDRSRYSSRDAERLDALAFAWAGDLIAVPADVPGPAPQDLGLDVDSAVAWLDGYAERANWNLIEHEAARRLDVGWLEHSPWPTIVGRAGFADRMRSPAWSLLAFAAPAGYSAKTPFGVVIYNATASPVTVHALICVPERRLIIEAFQRSADGAWLERHYGAPNPSTVERLHGPGALETIKPFTDHTDLDDADEPLNTLAPLLADVASAFR